MMMKRLFSLLLTAALLLGLEISLGEAVGVCPACGSENTERYCARCGAEVKPEMETPALTAGISRTAAVPDFMTADALAEKYGVGEYENLPVYTPKAPQPLNAYMIADRKFETADSDGFHTVEQDRISVVSPWLKEWAREIEEESLGAIRFVSDPDQADLLISGCQEYSFSGKYGYGQQVSAYSCKVVLRACLLSDPERITGVYRMKSPGDTISVSPGATRYWVGTPEMSDSSELRNFVSTILGWYGYTDAEEPDTAALQRALQARGAWAGPADGENSPALSYAVRSFQEQYGLAPTGRADKGTLTALFYSPETVRAAAGKYPKILADYNTDRDRVCASCGWIYRAEEDCVYCAHCGTGLQALYIGGIVRIGQYEQDNNPDNGPEPIEWYVMDIQDGKVLLMSKYGLDAVPYTTDMERDTWETCTLREWLNGKFLDTAFTKEEEDDILLTDVDNSVAQAELKRWKYAVKDVDDGAPTQDRIFLLSPHELVDLYYLNQQIIYSVPTDYAVANGASQSKYEEYWVDGKPSGSWWTRLTADGNRWAVCQTNGFNDFDETYVNVRPAMWVRMKTPERASGASAPVSEFIRMCDGDFYTIHVVDQNEKPVPDVYVNFCTDTSCTPCCSDESGIIVFGDAPGNYHVQVIRVPEGYSFDKTTEMYTGETAGEWELRIRKD